MPAPIPTGLQQRSMPSAKNTGGAHAERHHFVLVVDSDGHARFIFRSVLSYHGFDVVTASDGATGLELCDACPPDVVVIDVDPPTCASLDVVRAFAEHEVFCGAIIATTRRAWLHEQGALNALPIRAVLVKPVDPKAVLNVVRGSFRTPD